MTAPETAETQFNCKTTHPQHRPQPSTTQSLYNAPALAMMENARLWLCNALELDDATVLAEAMQLKPTQWNIVGCDTSLLDMKRFMLLEDRTGKSNVIVRHSLLTDPRNGSTFAIYWQEAWPTSLIVFRNVPATPLIVGWQFEVSAFIFEGVARSMAGKIVAEYRCILEPNQETLIQDLKAKVRQGAMKLGLLASQNQEIKMFLNGSAYQLPEVGTIWSHRASSYHPRFRLTCKTDVGRLRWSRWESALREGSATLTDDPSWLA